MSDGWPTRLRNPLGQPYHTPRPRVVGVEITGRCQLRCRHCYNHSGPDNPDELPFEVIRRVLDEVSSWGVRHIRISGGEPTWHPRFRDVVAACRARDLGIGLNTHGLYAAPMLDWLTTAPIDLFFVSLEGMKTCHEAIRGAGTFDRTVESIRALRAVGQRVMLSMHVAAGNRHDVPALAALAAELGADLKISPMRPIGRAVDELPWSLLSPAEYLQVVCEVTRLRRSHPGVMIRTDFDIVDETADGGPCSPDPAAESCKAGRTMVNIGYDGSIYPCAFFTTPDRRFAAGNVREVAVGAVWPDGAVFRPFRVHAKSADCQGCGHYRRRCAGGCPAVAHFTTGALDAHDPMCFAHLTAENGP